MYYQGSENKGADQLRGNREADLRLCFRICKKPVFSRRGSFISFINTTAASKDVLSIILAQGELKLEYDCSEVRPSVH